MDMAEDFCKSRFDAIDICNLLPTPTCSYHTDSNPIKNKASINETRSSLFHEEQEQERNNFQFTIHNVLEGPIPFESNTFDYVEQYMVSLAYKTDDWTTVLQEIHRVTKPGGYIQLIEPELYVRQLGPYGEQWQEHGSIVFICKLYIIHVLFFIVRQALRNKRGSDPDIATKLSQLLTELGLEEVTSRFVSIPLGQWGLDIGNLWEQNIDAFLESARPFFADIMQISSTDYKLGRQKLKEELKSRKAFNNVYVVYGRKSCP